MISLDNPFVTAFLDDMADVGIKKWALWTVLLALITWQLWGSGFIPYVGIIGLVFTLNLAFATAVTVYWVYVGRPKHKFTSVMDMVENNPRMERKDE